MTADPSPRWGIVADDLTGAADSAVGFADAGWPVLVLLGDVPPGETESGLRSVLATSTGARGANDEEARRRTSRAVAELRRLGTTRLFLKIDSAGRGSIAAQVGGALSAWAEQHPATRALVCPAYPRFGRQVRGGHILIDGAPLAGSATAHDPVSPRDEGDLTRIIPGARLATSSEGADPATVFVVDANDDDDLDRLAQNLDAARPETVAVGSGGLAGALGRVRPGPGGAHAEDSATPIAGARIIVAVSSQHPVSIAQIRQLEAASIEGVEVIRPRVSGTVTPEAAAAVFADQVVEAVGRGAERDTAVLVLVGGDGAAAALSGLGAEALRVEGSLLPGCPVSSLVGGTADGLTVVTKSGGFGDDGTLRAIAQRFGTASPRNESND